MISDQIALHLVQLPLLINWMKRSIEHSIYIENAATLMAIFKVIWNQLFSARSHRCQDNLRYGLQFYPDRDRCDHTETMTAETVVIVAIINIPVCTMSSLTWLMWIISVLFCSDHMESGQRVAEVSLWSKISGL